MSPACPQDMLSDDLSIARHQWFRSEIQEGPILQASHLDCKIHCLLLLDSALKEWHTCFRPQQIQTHTLWAGWHFHMQIISFPKPGLQNHFWVTPKQSWGAEVQKGDHTHRYRAADSGKWGTGLWRRNGEKRTFYLTFSDCKYVSFILSFDELLKHLQFTGNVSYNHKIWRIQTRKTPK